MGRADHPDDRRDDVALLSLLRGYAGEVNADFVSFWNEHVAFGGINPRFLAGHQPLEGAFSFVSPESKEEGPAPASAHDDKGLRADEEAGEKRDGGKKDGEKARAPEKPVEVLPSLPLAFFSLRNKLPRGERGSIALLLAEPGAGKTLWLRYHLATQIAGDIEQPAFLVPIYLPLNAYKGEKDLQSFIKSVLTANEQRPFHQQLGEKLESVMKGRPLMLLMDGLNEISETSEDEVSQKQRFVRALQAFVREHSTTCIVASRETEFVAGLNWHPIRINPLERVEVQRCLTIYAPAKAAEIYRLLDEQHLFGTLTSNPYRVRVLCEIYRSSGKLPQNLGALFEAFVATLVQREEARRLGQGEAWEPFHGWGTRASELARRLTDAEATSIELDELAASLNEPDGWSYAEGAGLLHLRHGRLQFSHQQIQEYFAALWLKTGLEVNGAEWDGFTAAVRKQVWDQPLLLLAGIAPPALLDSLIEPVAAVDPFLASRCVGTSPARVSATKRQWLADYLAQALTINKWDPELRRAIVQAAGEMRCEEGLGALTQPETATRAQEWGGADYYRAVAQANSPAAADVLIKLIEEALATRQNKGREIIRESVRALASMRVPEAQRFLARSLVDPRLYEYVLPAIAEVDTSIGYSELKALLAHANLWRHDEDDTFPALAAAAVNVAPHTLLPELLRHIDKPAALETLLRFGAGQSIIDDYVRRHAHTMRRQEWEADAQAFGMWPRWYGSKPGELIDLRNWLFHNAGEKAAGYFVDSLVAAVNGAQEYHSEHIAALQALTIMRQNRILPALKALRATESAKTLEVARMSSGDLLRFVNHAIEFLVEPRGMGITHHSRNRLALALRGVWATLDEKPLPESAEDLLEWARERPEQFDRLATSTLENFEERIKRSEWMASDDLKEFLRSVTGSFSERGWPELAGMLAHLLVAAAESSGEYSWHWLSVIVEQLVTHGRSGPAAKHDVARHVGPLVRRPNQELQLASIQVLALIDAGEQCAQWLDYLSDRTWPLAYVIVDALGCMTVPDATREALAAQLLSIRADERYFAVLALGSIGHTADLPQVLALANDPNVEVRRAVLWAVGQLGAAGVGAAGVHVADVLTGGFASPHGRLRREAASTVGELRLRSLGPELRALLQDIDLRVVERAAWALGRLGDRAGIAPLMNALENVVYRDDWQYPPGLHQRVEYRLKETIVTSLAQIRAGVNKDDVIKHLQRERGIVAAKGLFSALVAGRLDERAWERLDRAQVEHPGEPAEDEPLAEEQALDEATPKELAAIARRAADPRQRKRVFALLEEASVGESDFWEIVRNYRDPHPDVQLAYSRIAVGFGRNYDRNIHTLTGNPSYDMKLVKELGDGGRKMVLHIPLPEVWKWPTPLWLAQRFPDAYNLQPLTDALVTSLDAPYELDYGQRRALCSLLDRPALVRHSLADKVTWNPRELSRGLPPDDDFIWTPSIPYLLAQRRVWGIVPRLLEGLGRDMRLGRPVSKWSNESGRWTLYMVEALCELGVYQAAELVQESLAQLDPQQDAEVAVAQVMARVELSECFGEKLSERFDDEKFLNRKYGFGGGRILYLLSNILAESDSPQDFEEELKLQARLSVGYFGYYGGGDFDDSWLDRRLQRWGEHHLRQFIRMLGDEDRHGLIESIGESLMPYEQHHYTSRRTEQIARAIRRCPEAELASWLEDDSWLVRWSGFCGLGANGSAALDGHALRLLEDGNSQIVMGLLKRVNEDALPTLYRFLQGENAPESDGGCDDRVEERLHAILQRHLDSSDYGVKQAVISVLGEHHSQRFNATLSRIAVTDEPETAIVALQALRKIGDRSQAVAIMPLLDSPHLDVLRAAIETLAVLRHRPASARLLELLQHAELDIQVAATGACALMQIRKAVPILQQQLQALKAPRPLPPPLPVLKGGARVQEKLVGIDEDEDEPKSWSEYELQFVIRTMEFALFLLRATPRLPVGDMGFNAGDGLLALSSFFWYYLSSPLLAGWRWRMTDRGLPYPLGLLSLDDSRLLAHAMRRDLRAATWANRGLRAMMPASVALFEARPEAGRYEDTGGPEPGASVPWASTGDEAAAALVTATLDALGLLDHRLAEGWNEMRARWADGVEIFDMAALEEQYASGDDPPPDVIWKVVKTEIFNSLEHLSSRDLLLTRAFLGIYDWVEDLALPDSDSGLTSLINAVRSPNDASIELNDYQRLLLPAIGEDEIQFLIACQALAKLSLARAMLAGWGYSVLRRLQERFSDPTLGAGFEERVAPYLWPRAGSPVDLGIIPDDRRRPGEKVNPLAFMDAQ